MDYTQIYTPNVESWPWTTNWATWAASAQDEVFPLQHQVVDVPYSVKVEDVLPVWPHKNPALKSITLRYKNEAYYMSVPSNDFTATTIRRIVMTYLDWMNLEVRQARLVFLQRLEEAFVYYLNKLPAEALCFNTHAEIMNTISKELYQIQHQLDAWGNGKISYQSDHNPNHYSYKYESNPCANPTNDSNLAKILSYALPGMTARVEMPAECLSEHGSKYKVLRSAVMHLNDSHKWSREKIADWLDELHDSGAVNLEFQPWEEGETNEQDN